MIETRHDEKGSLDEVLAERCSIHLEQMTDKYWWLEIIDAADNRLTLEITASQVIATDQCRPTPAPADPETCLCPKDGMPSYFCPIHGRNAPGR